MQAAPDAPTNTVVPTISGTAFVGATLTADDGTWSATPAPTFAYQWQRCDADGMSCNDLIPFTAQTYLVQQADTGSTLRVVVTATNTAGTAGATSARTAPVEAAPANTVLPAISGVASEGQVLSAVDGAWSNSPTGFAYLWQRCDSAGANCAGIGGATSSAYRLVAADVGRTLRVVVTATNAVGSASATSDQTSLVQAAAGAPPVTVGKTAVGALTHALGGGYLEVSGRYALASAQSVTKLSAYVQGGGSATAVRAVIYADSGNQPGAFVAVSQSVTVAAGQGAGWVDFPVSGSPTLPAGQYWLGLWASNTSALGYYDSVSTSGRYAPSTFSAAGNPPASWPGGGSFDSLSYSLYATFGETGTGVPANTVLPAISGVATEGQVLSAVDGAWSNSPTGFAYQWQRCDSAGANCAGIGGATSSAYALVAADVGRTLRVVVTATNAVGSASATSDQTSLVQAAAGAPPVTVGKTAVGALTHALGGGYLEVSGRYALASAQSVTKLSAYVQGGGSATAVRAVIYADSGNQPGAFVAVSQSVTVAAGQGAGWVDFPVSGSPTLPAGQYWLGLWASNTSALGYYDSVSTSGRYAPSTFSAAGNPPASWPGGGSFDSLSYSLYATFGETGTGVPANTVLPAISGVATEGQVLSAVDGAWSNSPTGFAYLWQRCDSAGANCAGIGGATSSAYGLVAADVGRTLRVVVTATNAVGSASATSDQTSLVQAAAGAPPVTVGKTAVGALTHALGGGYLEVSGRYALASAQSVTKLSAYVQGGGSATAVRAVIYADSGNQPGAFVAVSQSVTVAAGQGAGWVDFSVSGSPTLPAGQYWLGLWASNTSALGYYDSVSTSGRYAPSTFSAAGNPPASWPGGGSFDSLSYSLYATLG